MDKKLQKELHVETVPEADEKRSQKVCDSSESNAQYELQIIRWLLKSLGVWPLPSDSYYRHEIFSYIVVTMCSMLLAFVIVPGCYLTFFQLKSPMMRLKVIGVLSFCAMSIMKYFYLISQRHNIAKCIKYSIADWRRIVSEHCVKIMIDCTEYGRYGSIICIIFMYGGGFFFTGILPFLTVTKDEKNITIRPLAYPSYYGVFDPQESPAYEIIYAIHFFSTIVMLSITSVSCSIASVFVMHACGQLDIIIFWLQDIVNKINSDEESYEKISMIVQQHMRTLEFIDMTEQIFCGICLVEVVGSTLNICLLGYYIILEWDTHDAVLLTTYGLLLSSFISNIFLFCFIGELLTEKCFQVSTAVYMIDWYKLSPNMALSLILIIQAAQTPIFLTAGKLINLSIFTFGTVIKTSVTYLNLLRTFVK